MSSRHDKGEQAEEGQAERTFVDVIFELLEPQLKSGVVRVPSKEEYLICSHSCLGDFARLPSMLIFQVLQQLR